MSLNKGARTVSDVYEYLKGSTAGHDSWRHSLPLIKQLLDEDVLPQ